MFIYKTRIFTKKVINNKCKNGEYYCCTSLKDAIEYALNELNKKNVDIEDLKCKKCLGNDQKL